MISALPVTVAMGKPPAMPFAAVIRSGSIPAYSLQKNFPVRPKPVWISSATYTIPCSSQSFAQRLLELDWGRVEAPLSLHRLDDDGRHVASRS